MKKISLLALVSILTLTSFGTWPSVVYSSANLVSNPSLETMLPNGQPKDWFQGRWGTNQALFTYPVAGYQTPRAAKVQITQYTSGDAKWWFKEIPVSPNTDYTFQNDYKSNTTSYVTVQYRSTTGTLSWTDIAILGPSTSWKHLAKTFRTPANAASLTIFHLIKNIGELTVDNYDLQSSAMTGMVTLNFDDGWKTTYQNALPILNNAGLKSSQYIISGRFSFPAYVNANEVLNIQASGHEIGSHTRTHPDLTTLTVASMQSEIFGSISDLKAIGVTSVDTFAYPFGAYNSTTDQVVQSAGFIGARTSDGGFNDQNSNKFLLKRQSVEITTTVAQVQAWINQAMQDKTWLILVFHRVDNSGTQYSITPANFQQIVDYLKQNNIPVVTTRQAIQALFPLSGPDYEKDIRRPKEMLSI